MLSSMVVDSTNTTTTPTATAAATLRPQHRHLHHRERDVHEGRDRRRSAELGNSARTSDDVERHHRRASWKEAVRHSCLERARRTKRTLAMMGGGGGGAGATPGSVSVPPELCSPMNDDSNRLFGSNHVQPPSGTTAASRPKRRRFVHDNTIESQQSRRALLAQRTIQEALVEHGGRGSCWSVPSGGGSAERNQRLAKNGTGTEEEKEEMELAATRVDDGLLFCVEPPCAGSTTTAMKMASIDTRRSNVDNSTQWPPQSQQQQQQQQSPSLSPPADSRRSNDDDDDDAEFVMTNEEWLDLLRQVQDELDVDFFSDGADDNGTCGDGSPEARTEWEQKEERLLEEAHAEQAYWDGLAEDWMEKEERGAELCEAREKQAARSASATRELEFQESHDVSAEVVCPVCQEACLSLVTNEGEVAEDSNAIGRCGYGSIVCPNHVDGSCSMRIDNVPLRSMASGVGKEEEDPASCDRWGGQDAMETVRQRLCDIYDEHAAAGCTHPLEFDVIHQVLRARCNTCGGIKSVPFASWFPWGGCGSS